MWTRSKARMGRRTLAAVVIVTALAGTGVAIAQDGDGSSKPAEHAGGVTTAAVSAQNAEAKFVSVTPCRVADTRSGGGRIAVGEIRTFDVVGTDLSAQGGNAAGCGIPARASAISINITAVDPLGTGFLRGNSGSTNFSNPSLPTATLLNYSTALNASNSVELPICSTYTGGFVVVFCDEAFVLGAFSNATHVVVDILGYFARPVYAIVEGDAVDPVDTAFRKQIGFESVERTADGNYTVVAIDNLSGCVVTPAISSSDTSDGVAPGLSITVDAGFTSGTMAVDIRDAAGAVANEDFTLTVTC